MARHLSSTPQQYSTVAEAPPAHAAPPPPPNLIELQLIGGAIFAYGITTLCTIVANLNLRGVAYRRYMDELDEVRVESV